MISIQINHTGAVADEVRQNLELLYGSRAGTAALDREFGLSQEWLDMPTEIAKAMISSEIIEKTRKYEPRAEISSIDFTVTDGKINPKVVIELVAD